MTVEELNDEVSAIDAIYPGSTLRIAPQIYNLKVPKHEDLEIQMSFLENYPDEMPSIIQLINNNTKKFTDTNYLEKQVSTILSRIFRKGEVCIFELFTELEDTLEEYVEKEDYNNNFGDSMTLASDKEIQSDDHAEKRIENPLIQENSRSVVIDPLKGWLQSEPIVDRGSTFIGYARKVNSVEEAVDYLKLLVTDKKIAKATHNISSWRIKKENGIQFQDSDDDGETAAGGRLLHLLTMMDVWNVIVVVSRWFGGTHLGPDRFKHINTAARNAVIKGEFLDSNVDNSASGKKKKK